jgi:hypothetical protein
MAEWFKAHAWKACVRETVPRVRIPLSPPAFARRRRATAGGSSARSCRHASAFGSAWATESLGRSSGRHRLGLGSGQPGRGVRHRLRLGLRKQSLGRSIGRHRLRLGSGEPGRGVRHRLRLGLGETIPRAFDWAPSPSARLGEPGAGIAIAFGSAKPGRAASARLGRPIPGVTPLPSARLGLGCRSHE